MGWRQTIYGSMPNFVADPESIDRNTGRQIDWSKVGPAYMAGQRYTITAGATAAIAATSITVAALPVALPVGTVLDFTGAGKFATLTANAAAGATAITVEALDASVINGNTAVYVVSYSQEKVIPAGTVMAELASGLIVPRAARPGAETAMGILWSTATSALYEPNSDSLSGYGIIIGGVIYENLLPEVITAYKTELNTAGVGTGFAWQTYADSREV